MSGPLFQPICQVRLTNVSVVRLKSRGYRFEVACYKNKVLNWRSGIESNIDEVLQTRTVFHNVSKGEFAKRESLLIVFGTDDQEEICKRILSKGEIQVAEKERKVTLENNFKDIVTILTELGVNPSTGLPLTRGMVEGALRDVGFSVRQGESAKKQSLRAMEILQRKMPDQIGRAFMRLKIVAIKTHEQIIDHFLTHVCDAEIESRHFSNTTIGGVVAATKMSQQEKEEKGGHVSSTLPVPTSTIWYTVIFLCRPRHYRELDQFILGPLAPSGNLQLLATNVKQIRSLPKFLPSESSDAHQEVRKAMEVVTKDPPTGPTGPTGPMGPMGLITCSTCEIFSGDKTSYRKHCQSDWHLFNLKRKVKNLVPITEQEYQELSTDIRLGFLAVDSS